MGDKYKFVRSLGQGGFGKAYLCQGPRNKNVCIKEIELSDSIYKAIKREVYILSQLNHPRIIQFIECMNSTTIIRIVMEYAPRGSLRDFLERQSHPLLTEILLKLFMDIVMGLEYLHIKNVIHGDLKPENLLLSRNNRIKICDFGISTVHDSRSKAKAVAGTPYYMAPEVLNGKGVDFKADIWAMGCIFYELCTLRRLFVEAKDIGDIKDTINKCGGPSWPCTELRYSDEVKNVCRGMLTFDPLKRASLPEIIRDEFIMLQFYDLYFDYYRDDSL